jgi:hypothetical protein
MNETGTKDIGMRLTQYNQSKRLADTTGMTTVLMKRASGRCTGVWAAFVSKLTAVTVDSYSSQDDIITGYQNVTYK